MEPEYKLTIQAWDKDIMSKDELIAACTLEMKPILTDSLLIKKQMIMKEEYFDRHLKRAMADMGDQACKDIEWEENDRFWVPLKKKDRQSGAWVEAGAVLCSFTIMPLEVAEKNPQGHGRQEPNNDPYCPPPIQRFQMHANPIKVLYQLASPRQVNLFLGGLCCLIVTIVAIVLLPDLIMINRVLSSFCR